MQNVTKEDMDLLVRLQDIELDIRRIERRLEGEAQRLVALDGEALAQRESVKAAESELESLRKEYREQERDVQMNAAKAKKSEERLWTIKNNKEYQSVLKEIETLKGKNSGIEDAMIQTLERTEEVERQLAERKKAAVQVTADIDRDKARILEEGEAERRRLAGLQADAREASRGVRGDLLELYRSLQSRIAGRAVVPVKDAVCTGCNLNIPPQLYNELHRCDALNLCPFCERIIYWRKVREA